MTTTASTLDPLDPASDTGIQDGVDQRDRGLSPLLATVIVAVIGVLVTATVSLTAWTLDRQNEHRLVEVQTRQAAAILSSTILTLRDSLETTLDIESATGGSVDQFTRFASTFVGPGQSFISAVLWKSDGTSWHPVAQVGEAPALSPTSSQARSIVDHALKSPTFVVTPIHTKGAGRVGYAIANSKDPTAVIYAERAIPANREVPVESGSAFSDLNFATYLGPTTSMAALATTDLPVRDLPLGSSAVRVAIPFGDSTLTLVTTPRAALGGTLGGALPWIFLVGGTLLTVGTAVVTYQLVGRRRKAERDALIIADLYEQLDGLYGEQRSIAQALQHALLPQRNPSIANLEIASRYLAGANGVEIGGDWFSLVQLGTHNFAFVVGDVSGKGIDAAVIMARLRFTIRAYLTEGHSPEVVLDMCSRQLDVDRDGHISTVLVGIGDTNSGVITLANAGHLHPLIVSGSDARFAEIGLGLPLGVGPSTYTATTLQLASGSALVAFTDGLVERRGESIDVGLERLARAASDNDSTLDSLLTVLTTALASDGPDDDIAIMAFRWTSPR